MDYINKLLDSLSKDEIVANDTLVDTAIYLRRKRIELGLSEQEAANKTYHTVKKILEYESGDYDFRIYELSKYLYLLTHVTCNGL